jgi:hypothetical protein
MKTQILSVNISVNPGNAIRVFASGGLGDYMEAAKMLKLLKLKKIDNIFLELVCFISVHYLDI